MALDSLDFDTTMAFVAQVGQEKVVATNNPVLVMNGDWNEKVKLLGSGTRQEFRPRRTCRKS